MKPAEPPQNAELDSIDDRILPVDRLLTVERVCRNEEYRAGATGFGTTRQGRALSHRYRETLAERIAADRANPHNRDVWRVIKDIPKDDLVWRLLTAGISATAGSELGTNRDGEKTFLHQALWIGDNFGQRGLGGLRMGEWAFNMLLALPGVFALDPADVLELTADANDFLDEVLSQAVDNNPLLYPVTTPPLDWTQVNKGGLPAEHWARVSLIGDNHPAIMGAVRKAIGTGQMQPVLDAVNSLQRVPYRINEHVYEFILRDGEPPGPDDDRPPVWQEQKYKEWQQASAALQAFNKDMVFAHSMLATAGRFYVPLNMDCRGRVNAIPHFSFYREDRVRALFLFADGEPIGEDGLKWLKAHVARTANGNTWSSEEKPGNLGLEQRIAWTDKHLGQLRAVGESVLRGDDPKKIAWALPKKDRYQFVAACVELVQALDEGPEFITRLPLMFDATCSGLQHMCAMIRSEEGRFVNLTPSEDGADFYGFIAFQLHQHAFDLLCDDPFDYEIVRGDSRFWSRPSIEVVSDLRENPFDRELVKGPTVSFFYGSAPVAGMKDAIIETLEKRRILTYGAISLAFAIQRAIKRTVPQATALRNSLKKLAKLCAQQNKYLRWTTPLGMPVINCYHEPVFADIPVYLDGRRRRAKFIVGDKKEVWEECAGKGAAANFVHSADAALLHFVALACAKAGISLVTVHDCFGALAPRAGQLNEILGEQLSHLHDRHDMVADVWKYARRTLRKDTKIPPEPERGALDLKQVRASGHAFK